MHQACFFMFFLRLSMEFSNYYVHQGQQMRKEVTLLQHMAAGRGKNFLFNTETLLHACTYCISVVSNDLGALDSYYYNILLLLIILVNGNVKRLYCFLSSTYNRTFNVLNVQRLKVQSEFTIIQSNLAIRNVLIRNLLVLRNHLGFWQILI